MRWLLLAALLLLAAPEAWALNESCTDNVNCWCDVAASYGTVVFCEDFEDPVLGSNTEGDGDQDGWYLEYGNPVDGCYSVNGQVGDDIQGDCETCCVKIVAEEDCGVSGQEDCVAQGSAALGLRYSPGSTSGIVGEKNFTGITDLGIIMIVKYSENFDGGSGPKKTDEFGATRHCLLGCSSGTYVSGDTGSPFHGLIFDGTGDPAPSASTGNMAWSGVALGWYPNVPGDYSFPGVDTYACWRLQIEDLGQSVTTIRHWVNDVLMVEGTANTTGIDGDEFIDGIAFNAYINGGYPGASIAYRYEDNVTIYSGTSMPTCAQAGFGEGGPAPAIYAPYYLP